MSCTCRYGPHVSVKDTIFRTLNELDSKCKCCQIFLGNPQSYVVRKLSEKDALQSREYLESKNMKLYIHANYIINLASMEENIVNKGRKCLEDTIDSLEPLGSMNTGIILHIGAKGTIQNVVNQINDMNIKVPVLLENSAGEGSKLGKDLNELRLLMEGIDSSKVGVCIDTCHSFASGMVDFREMNKTEQLFEDMSFMENRPWIFHVNDSLTDYGGKKDRHSSIGYGYIWNYNVEGSLNRLRRFYELAKENCNDIVFETPNPITDYFEGNFIDLIN